MALMLVFSIKTAMNKVRHLLLQNLSSIKYLVATRTSHGNRLSQDAANLETGIAFYFPYKTMGR